MNDVHIFESRPIDGVEIVEIFLEGSEDERRNYLFECFFYFFPGLRRLLMGLMSFGFGRFVFEFLESRREDGSLVEEKVILFAKIYDLILPAELLG